MEFFEFLEKNELSIELKKYKDKNGFFYRIRVYHQKVFESYLSYSDNGIIKFATSYGRTVENSIKTFMKDFQGYKLIVQALRDHHEFKISSMNKEKLKKFVQNYHNLELIYNVMNK